MKKLVLFLFVVIVATGCTNIRSAEYESIISESLSEQQKITNEKRVGYQYYLPKGLRILKTSGTNDVFANENNYYYLYVDEVSYYNKIKADYTEKKDVIYSKKITKDDKFGYLEIKKTSNNQYFIEIMYNYAKIEVIVTENKIKEAVAYSISILGSIEYQDTVLKNLMEENTLNSNEMVYNIFETAQTESGYLEIIETYGQYEEDEEKAVDPDFIRR